MTSDARHEAQDGVRRLIEQLLALLDEGEHLGSPSRSEHRIVIPIDPAPSTQDADEASMRALLAAWLDQPPSDE
jgi:hypothetical protein